MTTKQHTTLSEHEVRLFPSLHITSDREAERGKLVARFPYGVLYRVREHDVVMIASVVMIGVTLSDLSRFG